MKKDGYWNYDKSEFDRPSPLLDDDDAMEALWKKQYSLTQFLGADQFKSYDELEARLNSVLKSKPQSRRIDEEVDDEDNDRGSYTPDFSSRRPEPELPIVNSSSNDEDEDDALSYFQRLAEE